MEKYMGRAIEFIKLHCADCLENWQYSHENLEEWLCEEPTMMSAISLYSEFECPRCGSGRIYVYGDQENLLVNPNDIKICEKPNCQTPIPIPRLETFPSASTCPICANEKTSISDPQWPFPPDGKEECPKCGNATEVRMPKNGGNYFLGCSDFPNCWWKSQVRQDDLQWTPTKRSRSPQDHDNAKEGSVDDHHVPTPFPLSPSSKVSDNIPTEFTVPWETGGQPRSWTVRICRTDKIVEIVDQDGLITELPMATAERIAEGLSDALSPSTIENISYTKSKAIIVSAIERMVEGKAKPILQAMANSEHALSFAELMSLTDLSRPQVEGVLGAITAVLRKMLGDKNVKLWDKKDGRYHLREENLKIIRSVLQ
jgi:hypothetical protein